MKMRSDPCFLAEIYGAKRDAVMRNRRAYIKRVLAQTGDGEPSYEAACAVLSAA
jgi:hypothetical protein